MLKDLNILLGVTGGIAAYKVVDLASKLTAAGASVRTVMTESACQLVGPKSFEAVTAAPVYTSLWSDPQGHSSVHISLADWARIVVVAPASADIIGKAANGICDDLLSTTLCVCLGDADAVRAGDEHPHVGEPGGQAKRRDPCAAWASEWSDPPRDAWPAARRASAEWPSRRKSSRPSRNWPASTRRREVRNSGGIVQRSLAMVQSCVG